MLCFGNLCHWYVLNSALPELRRNGIFRYGWTRCGQLFDTFEGTTIPPLTCSPLLAEAVTSVDATVVLGTAPVSLVVCVGAGRTLHGWLCDAHRSAIYTASRLPIRVVLVWCRTRWTRAVLRSVDRSLCSRVRRLVRAVGKIVTLACGSNGVEVCGMARCTFAQRGVVIVASVTLCVSAFASEQSNLC